MQNNFWKKIKTPIMALAPMSGVTDASFRRMLCKCGRPDVFWTEFVSVDGLFSRGKKHCLEILQFSAKEHPIVAQVFGSDPVQFEKAAQLIAELGFDGIDINMGCPDGDVEKRGAGAALIKNPDLAVEIIRAVKRGLLKGCSEIPVSVKTRIGYDKNQIDEWIPILLKENIAALTVHLRTRNELYAYPANWKLARQIVKLRDTYAPETVILGNGDIKSLAEARELAEQAGLDGVMIGRSVLGNPWFFSGQSPTLPERLKAVIEHAEIFDDLHKDNIKEKKYYKKFASVKKYFHGYVKEFSGVRDLRERLMRIKNTSDIKKVVKDFLEDQS
jgi:nifR3 family TIM-barrel protein